MRGMESSFAEAETRRMRRFLPLALVIATATIAAGSAQARWSPPVGIPWQWQLDGQLKLSVDAPVYDVDGFETSAHQVHRLHALGRHVVCYVNAGAWENWRKDKNDFPASVLGNALDGWPGERWLDIRRIGVLGPIMRARIQMCANKGFDAVEPDNVEGYANKSGFPLSGRDQLRYNRWFANAAHKAGLSVALKNDLGQVKALISSFDFAVVEECFQYRECGKAVPFVDAGKAVLETEYELSRAAFCAKAHDLGFSSMRKRLSLRAWRRPCP
jgi:hypothetical protein